MTVAGTAGKRLFCFGYGFSASALGALIGRDGWSLAGTCRTPDGCRALAEVGVDAVPFSREAPLADAAGCLAGATHILLSIPPDDVGDPALDCHGADIAALPGVEWIGYLSTTGVYGDTGGAWVDESAAPAPTGVRGGRRLEGGEELACLRRAARPRRSRLSPGGDLRAGAQCARHRAARRGQTDREARPGLLAHPRGRYRAGAGRLHRAAEGGRNLQCVRRRAGAGCGGRGPCLRSC